MPDVEALVHSHRERHDPVASAGVPAHITLAYPFAPPQEIGDETETALRDVFSGFVPFHVEFGSVGRFRELVWLAPTPVQPLLDLMRAVWTRWAEHPPYGGEIPAGDVVPHLTVAHLGGSAADDLAASLDAGLPIAASVDRIWLMASRNGRWTTRCVFPLGAG